MCKKRQARPPHPLSAYARLHHSCAHHFGPSTWEYAEGTCTHAPLRSYMFLNNVQRSCTFPQLLDDFSGHNIESACALVEGAGRFMYRCPETRVRMENMMEVGAWVSSSTKR